MQPRKILVLHLPVAVDTFVAIQRALVAEFPEAVLRDPTSEDGETVEVWSAPDPVPAS